MSTSDDSPEMDYWRAIFHEANPPNRDKESFPPLKDFDCSRVRTRHPCEFARELALENPHVPWDTLLHEPMIGEDYYPSEKKGWDEKSITPIAACENGDLILHDDMAGRQYYYFTRMGNEDELYRLGDRPAVSLVHIWTCPHNCFERVVEQ